MILTVQRDTAVEILNHLDEFQDKMNKFIEKHPSYSFDSQLVKEDNYWELKVKVNKDERRDTSTT